MLWVDSSTLAPAKRVDTRERQDANTNTPAYFVYRALPFALMQAVATGIADRRISLRFFEVYNDNHHFILKSTFERFTSPTRWRVGGIAGARQPLQYPRCRCPHRISAQLKTAFTLQLRGKVELLTSCRGFENFWELMLLMLKLMPALMEEEAQVSLKISTHHRYPRRLLLMEVTSMDWRLLSAMLSDVGCRLPPP